MSKKRNLIFLSLLILGVLLITSCLPKPPVTEGILKGQVIVPESSKQLTGQALADATVNIIDPATGDIIATTVTDADGYYQVFVPAGGPYLLRVVKDGVVILQITPQVEVGIEYDLGTADCNTTAVALIALAMMDAGANLADINLADIAADPNFDDVLSSVTSIIEAGGDPTESAVVQQVVEDFLSPPAPTPPAPTPSSAKEIISYKFEAAANSALSSDVIATVNSGAHTVALTVPYGTDLTALVATFELSTSATAKIGSTDQVSGTNANDFTSPVTYTVTAEDGSTQDWVITVTVAIGPLDHFSITGYPVSTTAGQDFGSNNIVITAYDADNDVKTDYTGEVYFTSTDGSATLPYTLGSKYTFTAGDNGTHTFPGTGFILKTAGLQNITLTDGTVSVTSSSITVTAGAVASFVVTTEHSGTETAGISFSVTITAKDSEGNTATGYTGVHNIAWTWTATSSPLAAPTKPTDGNQTFSDGVVTVTGFTLTNSGETPTITAIAGSVSGTTSVITVNDGSLSYVKTEDVAGGTGSEVTTHSMTTLDTFTVYAASYDACGNYISDQSVSWTGTGECSGKLSPTSGTSTTFTPTTAGTGTIIADHASATDDTTGTITVSFPPVHNITQDTYYNTIQAALSNADTDNTNTIEVADGTYYEKISFPSNKAIVLKSENGKLLTTIDGGGSGSVVKIENCTKDITLDGFTITGGSANSGGGIYISNSLPTIQNNTISGNTGNYYGGGIYIIADSLPTIQNNTISGNTTQHGGGIYISNSLPTIQYNTISGNTASYGGGGGIYNVYSSSTIQNNTISGNTASTHHGGGVLIGYSSPIIKDNTISGNTASYGSGGGIFIAENSSPTIQNNTISENTASDGGGVLIGYSSPTIQNNTISGNTASSNGGGIYSDHSSPAIQNNTISENIASYGGGIYNIYSSSSSSIQNNTISGNTATDNGGGILIWDSSTAIGGVGNENTICANFTGGTCTITNQVNPNSYPYNYICVDCTCGFATLRALSLSTGTLTPTFDCDTISYTATVANDITSITVTPTANCNGIITVNGTPVASGSASGAISLNVGENTITIVVTAEDGTTTKTYTVTVTRAAS